MMLGICLKAANSLYFGRIVEFIFEFIPQFVMMGVLFGYMSALIIVKWLTFWKDTSKAPSIISFMINIFLKQGEVSGSPLIGSKSFNESLNFTFLVIAVLCIPLMLLVKPLY
jgi:V-type H+-transporting ATPase subunit a